MCGSPSKARMPESLARAPPGPVPPAVVHTPGGLALPTLQPGARPRPRWPMGLPETRPRAPAPRQPTHRNSVPAAPRTPRPSRPAPDRGRQPSDTQAEVRPAPLRSTARRAARRAPRRPSVAAWPISARPAGRAGGGTMPITFSGLLLSRPYRSPAHTGEWRHAQPIIAWRRWVYADTGARRKGRQEEGE